MRFSFRKADSLPRWGWIALLALTSCNDSTPEPAGFASSGSTIVYHEGSLWLTSPDDDEIVRIAPNTLAAEERFAVPGAPERLAVVGTALLATLGQASEVARFANGAWSRHPVPCGGTSGIAGLSDGSVVVACPHDDRLVQLRNDGMLQSQLEAEGGPLAVAVLDGQITVSLRRGSLLQVRLSEGGLQIETELPLTEEPGFAASQTRALHADGHTGSVTGVFQRVDHDSDRNRDPSRGGYGSVVDGEPRIEPRLIAPCGGRYAVFDGGNRVFSGPSAVLYDGTRGRLFVANEYTNNVAVLRCSGGGLQVTGGLAELIENVPVGGGPRGLALGPSGDVFVDVGFDHAVSRIVVGQGGRPETLRRQVEISRLSADALRGRRLFHDAQDIHLTPSGVVTCATCHPAGGDDGLVWFLHTEGVARKLRRTPPAWGARAEFLPFHWDGEFDSAELLTGTTVRELMEGDGLLIDLRAMATYMAEVPLPPPSPGQDAMLVAEGQTLFETQGCATCHVNGTGVDGVAHSVIAQSADPDAQMDVVHTPPLAAIRNRAPYLHDGRADTLLEVITTENPSDTHGMTSFLNEGQRDALISYLQSL
ncbi:MAG: c-type cytochrome [Myxococcota bacterium]